MRTLVDIEEKDIADLDEIAEKSKKSRAALIRAAIGEFLAKRRARAESDAFGLWGDRKIDGLAYQRKARAEW